MKVIKTPTGSVATKIFLDVTIVLLGVIGGDLLVRFNLISGKCYEARYCKSGFIF